jgi:hypothetical protein
MAFAVSQRVFKAVFPFSLDSSIFLISPLISSMTHNHSQCIARSPHVGKFAMVSFGIDF